MNEATKRLHIYAALGMLEMVRSLEEDINPKSARSLALKNLIDNSIRVGDFYNINKLCVENTMANRLLDEFYENVRRTFSPKLVGRDARGRFCSLET